jgi:hypothetical protein
MILVSSALLASSFFRVAGGILANAALSGANTVMFAAELSVSTRPAALTAVTRVDSAGLAEAAVATGAVAMPVKLPAPDLGTAAQPGPKSLAAVAGEEDTAVGEEAGEDEDELHAAAPRLRLTARPDRARRRYFMFVTP